jgi:hypothetical protein
MFAPLRDARNEFEKMFFCKDCGQHELATTLYDLVEEGH